MAKQTVLETFGFLPTARTGPVTGVIAAFDLTSAGALWLTNSEFVAGDVVIFVDDAGVYQYHTVAVGGVADGTLTLNEAIRATASGAAGNTIFQVKAYSQYFQPQAGLNAVPFIKGSVSVGGPPVALVSNPNAQAGISQSEGVLIKSAYFRLPYQFTAGANHIGLSIMYAQVGAVPVPIPELQSTGGMIYFPMENQEVELNIFVPPPFTAGTGNRWNLYMGSTLALTAGSALWTPTPFEQYAYNMVSCLSAPAALNNQFLPILCGLKIQHGINLA